MRIAIIIGMGLGLLAAHGVEGQGTRCFALEFPDSAPRFPKGLAEDTLVLSDMPLGDFDLYMPGGRRAFLSLREYRELEPLTIHAQGWRTLGRDSIEIRPVRIIYALIWKGEALDHGLRGEVQVVGANRDPTYRFRAAQVPCPYVDRGRTTANTRLAPALATLPPENPPRPPGSW